MDYKVQSGMSLEDLSTNVLLAKKQGYESIGDVTVLPDGVLLQIMGRLVRCSSMAEAADMLAGDTRETPSRGTSRSTWIVDVCGTGIDLMKVSVVGPVTGKNFSRKYTVTFIDGDELTLWEVGFWGRPGPVALRSHFMTAWRAVHGPSSDDNGYSWS